MPAISFSVTTSRGPLWALILNGEKRQTLRTPREHPFAVGQQLSLYWRQRTPAAEKPIHLIMETECIEARRVDGADIYFDEAMALADGFGSLEEFQAWIMPPDEGPVSLEELAAKEYTLVRWRYPGRNVAKVTPEAMPEQPPPEEPEEADDEAKVELITIGGSR